ncbi:MAG: TolC family protein [Candidatus Omnitrophica bacterium]|nr:TolC family protein [Candidatus Omnitrophota bacterium]
MNRLIVILVIFGLIAWHIPVLGAEEMPRFDKEAFIASAESTRTLELAMVDCIAMALKNNSEINVKRISPQIEDANVMIKRAAFEPDLSFDFTMEDNTELSPSTLAGTNTSKTRTGKFNFGYDQKLVTGTQLSIDFYNTRTRSNSRIQSMNPQFDSQAEITVTQPLLKGFGLVVNKADFLIAKNNKLKSKQEFAQEVMNVLTDVKKSYYDLQYSQEQYRTAKDTLKRVEGLHEINKEKQAKGLASNVDLLESEAELARANQALLAQEATMKLAEDNLKLITNLVDDPELWNADIMLLDELSYKKEEVRLSDTIKKAFDYRPDYEAAKIDLKNKEISVVFNKNGMLPIVDLTGSYGLNGLGKNYEKDLGHIGGGKYPDWVVGVKVSMPLGSDEEKGRYEKSKLEKAQALINFKRLEQKIILEVRDAVRNVKIRYRVLEASSIAKEAEGKNYEAQETRFSAGLVSTLDILTYQERLSKADANYIKSVIDYNISLIELARAEGVTLVNDNIRIE